MQIMKSRLNTVLKIGILSLFLSSTATAVYAQNTRTLDGTIPLADGISELAIKSSDDLIVETHDRAEILYSISITQDKWSKNDTLLESNLLSYRQDGSALKITFNRPYRKDQNGSYNEKEMTWIKALLKGDSKKNSYYRDSRTSIRLTIPENSPVMFNLNRADLELTGLSEELTIDGKSADVLLSDISGNITINNSYGDIEMDDIKGDVTIDTRSSDIEIETLEGELVITTDYSDIELSQITGNIDIDNRSGELELSGITGNINLTSDYSDVEIEQSEGSLVSEIRSGELIVRNFSGGLSHSGDYTDVELSEITGTESISIEARSAEIKLFEIHIPIDIDGDYLDISGNRIRNDLKSHSASSEISLGEVDGAISITGSNDIRLNKITSNAISIDNDNNDIELEFDNILPEQLNITGDGGDVTMDLSELSEISADFKLQVENGSLMIDNKELESQEVNTNQNGQLLETVLGGGAAKITVTITDGKLRIR